jgi:hypothetical protein
MQMFPSNHANTTEIETERTNRVHVVHSRINALIHSQITLPDL